MPLNFLFPTAQNALSEETAVAAEIWSLNATGLTFVVPQREVQIASGRDGQGEVEPVATGWFVLVHSTDSLDDLEMPTGTISPSKQCPDINK